jgi:hypothetical protein
LVHNGPKHTPPHEQTHEQFQTHSTQHNTIHTHMGEKTGASPRDLCRRRQRCATPRRNPLQTPTAPGPPPPWDYQPQTANTQPSIPRNHRSFSTHPPPQHLGRPLILAKLRGGLASPTASLSAKESSNKRRKEGISCTPPTPSSPSHQAQQLKASSTHGPSAP